ncbi:phosphotransferase [Glaciecola sp. MH2013]|uniref:phosphotransferase n=1 Tax=Glaciecola sp. MH2013 TaxID=2785524 RepID=UPI00189F607E|nr:phosphotransferase [Glaciecola sp. MH2013]MBF7071798.1 phosphotransferase [Glaciecola sp. MH2013]
MSIEQIRRSVNLSTKQSLSKVEIIQSLWSGYGEIARYQISGASNTSSLIVKQICSDKKTQHPRQWDGNLSHQRKLSSYKNEAFFYAHYSQLTNKKCRVPHFLGEWQLATQNKNETNSGIIMEDLDASGFTLRTLQADMQLIKLGLAWLAHFHALFLRQNNSQENNGVHKGLWPIGSYWHLATRPDELSAMQASELKEQAVAIDEKLNSTKYQTLVHGDAKIANFCIKADLSELAMVDFQYVGSGAGIKDIIYFLGSCMNEKALKDEADNMSDYYFTALHHALIEYNKPLDVVEEWRALLPYAWADFERFLAGWSPEHHKLTAYSSEQTQKALRLLEK